MVTPPKNTNALSDLLTEDIVEDYYMALRKSFSEKFLNIPKDPLRNLERDVYRLKSVSMAGKKWIMQKRRKEIKKAQKFKIYKSFDPASEHGDMTVKTVIKNGKFYYD